MAERTTPAGLLAPIAHLGGRLRRREERQRQEPEAALCSGTLQKSVRCLPVCPAPKGGGWVMVTPAPHGTLQYETA